MYAMKKIAVIITIVIFSKKLAEILELLTILIDDLFN